jgi:hypothetical protein
MSISVPLAIVGRVVVLSVAPVAMLALISVNEEIALGRQAQQQVKKDVPELADGTIAS